MKKALSIILCFVILIFSVVGVSATKTDPEKVYYIKDLGFTIHTPLFTAATRDVNNLGISQAEYEEMLSDFEAMDIYYWGYSYLFYYNDNSELIIYGDNADINSLTDVSDSRLELSIKSQKEQWEKSGATVVKSEIYESYDAKYIMSHLRYGEMYGINYYTVKNGKNIEIVMWCRYNEPTADARQELVNMINTIKFDKPADIHIYEKTFTLSIAENGKLTPLGRSLVLAAVILLIQLIAGVVVLVILLNQRKRRRQNALNQSFETAIKFCIFCGTELKQKDNFCHRCGKNQNPNNN